MIHDARLLLAVRTILVTTRVAVAKNSRAGRPRLRVATARRGLSMLDALDENVGLGAPREVREALDAGRRELLELAGDAADQTTPISVVGDDEDGVAADTLDDRPRLGD